MNENNSKMKKIIVAGEALISEQLRKTLTAEQFEVLSYSKTEINNHPDKFGDIDLVLINDRFIDELSNFRHLFPLAEIIIISDSELGQQIMNHAVVLPTNSTDSVIVQMIKVTARNAVTARENLSLKTNIAMSFGFDNLAGNSRAMNKIKETVTKLAPTDITLLVTGPEGCGKKLIASVLHFHSKRRRHPMVTIDFNSASEQQLLLEISGDQQNPGALTQAHLGTLFLRNISKAPAAIQDLLVEFMRTRQIQGYSGQHLTIDTRVIVSSSDDLETMTMEGNFRPELWHLINEIPVTITPLSEHKDDLEQLVEYFIRRANRNLKISTAGMTKLRNYNWPGDIRELETVLQRAASVCKDDLIESEDIPGSKTDEKLTPQRQVTTVSERNGGRLADGQRSIIEKALDENDWNFTQTANELGIGRTTLWRKVKKYNLERGIIVKEL